MQDREYLYNLSFIYKGKRYNGNISTYAEYKPDTDPHVVWPFAEEVIKPILSTIQNRTQGSKVHDVVVGGPFGIINLKP